MSVESVREALEKAVDEAVAGFSEYAFTQMKIGLAYFIQGSQLKTGFRRPDMPFDRLLCQEALNLGINEILKDGLSDAEFMARLTALDYPTANRVLRTHVLGDGRKTVLFTSVPR